MKIKFSTLTTIFALVLVTVLIALVIVACRAESGTESQIYVLCSPTSGVFLRTRPSKQAPEAGFAEAGFALKTDWRTKNGWIHLIDVPGEYSECWIYSGYTSTTEPEWLMGGDCRGDRRRPGGLPEMVPGSAILRPRGVGQTGRPCPGLLSDGILERNKPRVH